MMNFKHRDMSVFYQSWVLLSRKKDDVRNDGKYDLPDRSPYGHLERMRNVDNVIRQQGKVQILALKNAIGVERDHGAPVGVQNRSQYADVILFGLARETAGLRQGL